MNYPREVIVLSLKLLYYFFSPMEVARLYKKGQTFYGEFPWLIWGSFGALFCLFIRRASARSWLSH